MRAFLYGAPIGVLGGLIGLGGAEFRLPVLTEVFRYSARLVAHRVGGQSVPPKTESTVALERDGEAF